MHRSALLLALVATLSVVVLAAQNPKIDSFVYNAIEKAEIDSIEVLVLLSGNNVGQAFFSRDVAINMANQMTSKVARGNFLYKSLRSIASSSQREILPVISSYASSNNGITYRTFWLVNSILLSGLRSSDVAFLESLAERHDVEKIVFNPSVALKLPEASTQENEARRVVSPSTVEESLKVVQAPDVWAKGITGRGVVIAGADTGYQWDHPALKRHYRGFVNNVTVNHNYNWHDAIHSGGGKCGKNARAPCDDGSHGTHTMGTMLGNTLSEGDNGFPNSGVAIGVAPGAKWIGCRNMNVGAGTPAQYIECFEWFIAPTDLDGENPDPSMAPHVISNSWGCPSSEGCRDPEILEAVANATRAAGIVVVAAAGNEGSSCSTVGSPIGTYPSVFSVGATSVHDDIAYFSSRGPVKRNGELLLKPDISAPGVSIRSCVPTNSYGTMSGTSMATPHVAGLVALLIDANPKLAGNVDKIEDIIKRTAVPLQTTQNCGDTAGKIPNNVYGYGRINALAAVELAKSISF